MTVKGESCPSGLQSYALYNWDMTKQITHTFQNRTAVLCMSPAANAPLVFFNTHFENPDGFLQICRTAGCPDFHLLFVTPLDWDRDLSPWPAAAVMKGQEDFSGHADEYLSFIEDQLLPWAQELLPSVSRRILGGYSMGGLFALYALTKTGLFSMAAAVSPSVWYPDFTGYMKTHPVFSQVKAVDLSLGTKESKTRNPLMKNVLEDLKEVEQILESQQIRCSLQMNPGNHFFQPDLRCAAAIARLLKQ